MAFSKRSMLIEYLTSSSPEALLSLATLLLRDVITDDQLEATEQAVLSTIDYHGQHNQYKRARTSTQSVQASTYKRQSLVGLPISVLTTYIFRFLSLRQHIRLGRCSRKCMSLGGLSMPPRIYWRPSAWMKPLIFAHGISERQLRQLTHMAIRDLSIPNSFLSTSSFEMLSSMSCLTTLDIKTEHFSGEKMDHLIALHRLERLVCFGETISSSALKCFIDFPVLSSLRLCIFGLTDNDMEHIGRISALQCLELLSHNMDITDTGVEHLQGISGLKCLVLRGSGITDQGLKSLEQLVLLEHLDLRDSESITDQGLKSLQTLNLTKIDLRGCDITEHGVQSSLKHIPSVLLHYE